MAEYYPLLARAVAALPNSNPESRRSIYDRARAALIAQLRAVQPPIAEEDIQRESRMLDEAIAKLEAEAEEAAQKPAPPVEAPAPVPPPVSSAPPVTAQPEAPKRAEPLVKRPEGDGSPPPRLAATRPLSGLPGLPARPVGEKGLGALEAARQRLANLARSASSRPTSRVIVPPPFTPPSLEPAKPSVPFSVPTPGARFTPPAARPVEPTPSSAAQVEEDAIKPSAEAEEVPSVDVPPTDEAQAIPAPVLRKYGPRAEAAGVSADMPPAEEGEAQGTSESDSSIDEEAAARGPSHPAAPQPVVEKKRNLRPILIGVPVAIVVTAIAVFAYMQRDNPDDMARLRPAPGAEGAAESQQGKIVERIGGGVAQVPRPNTPSAPPAQPMQPNAPAAATPVAQRAALLLDAPGEPDRVKTFVGNVVWRLDNVSRGPGQPLAVGVRAEIDLPDAKLKAVMLIQKNTDETLPASHTIELRFTPADGSPVPGVAQIQTPQLRREDTPSGDPLMGVPAPILRNYFLVGLTRGDLAVGRNVDLIRNRGWIDVPMLLTDQRIAKITFEKGSAGERIINEAFDAWR